MKITLKKRLNTLDYEHVEVEVSQDFDKSVKFEDALEIVETNLDNALCNQIKDFASLKASEKLKKEYFDLLLQYYSLPKSTRRTLS